MTNDESIRFGALEAFDIICDRLGGYQTAKNIVRAALSAKDPEAVVTDNEKIYKRALEEIREQYIGTEGGIAETAYEGYLLQEIKKLYQIAIDTLRIVKETA